MKSTYLARESQDASRMVVRKRRARGAQTEQQLIRAEYLEVGARLYATVAECSALDTHRAALQMRCAHPDLGRGTLPGQFNQPVAPNQCPDCGYVTDEPRDGQRPVAGQEHGRRGDPAGAVGFVRIPPSGRYLIG